MRKRISGLVLVLIMLVAIAAPTVLAYYDHGGSNGLVPTYLVYYDHGGSNG